MLIVLAQFVQSREPIRRLKKMPLSTDVNLPKQHEARFSDKLLVWEYA